MPAEQRSFFPPLQPFTVTHCLHNHDTLTHTFTLETSSSQRWPYTYHILPRGNPDPVTPLTSTRITLPREGTFANRVGILAVYTPTSQISSTMQEQLAITATSTLSPTQVWANGQTFIFGRDFDPLAGAGSAVFRAFSPAVLRNR